jgi:micrococcal nuclease
MTFRRRVDRRLWLPVIVLIVAALLQYLAPTPAVPRDPQQLTAVERVVDGDTLIIAGGQRVRLLGINTPELARDGRPAEPWADEARKFLQSAVEGRDISLGFDREHSDKYGRWLAYVYLQGTLINEEIIRAGWSRAETKYRYSEAMKVRFRRAEREARDQRAGMWSADHGTAGGPSLDAEEFQNQ